MPDSNQQPLDIDYLFEVTPDGKFEFEQQTFKYGRGDGIKFICKTDAFKVEFVNESDASMAGKSLQTPFIGDQVEISSIPSPGAGGGPPFETKGRLRVHPPPPNHDPNKPPVAHFKYVFKVKRHDKPKELEHTASGDVEC